MAKAKVKETQSYLERKSLIEIESEHSQLLESRSREVEYLVRLAREIADLDPSARNYISRVKSLTESAKMTASDMEYVDSMITIIEPILKAKQAEAKDTEALNKWKEVNREALKPLIEMADRLMQEALKDESWLEAVKGDEKLIIQYHEHNLAQTIYMIKDYVGDLTEITYIKYNNGRGFDGVFIGTKASIRIQTILAWGAIIRPHYRTLVQIYK